MWNLVCMPCGLCEDVCGDEGTCHWNSCWDGELPLHGVFFCMFVVVALPCTFIILRKDNLPKRRQQCEYNGDHGDMLCVLPGPTQDSIVRDIQSIPQHSTSFPFNLYYKNNFIWQECCSNWISALHHFLWESSVLTACGSRSMGKRGLSRPWLGG